MTPLITVMLHLDETPGWQPELLAATSNLDRWALAYRHCSTTYGLNRAIEGTGSDLIALIDPDIMPQPGWGQKVVDTFTVNGLRAAFGDGDELALLGLLRPTEGRYPTWQTLVEHGSLWDRHEVVDPGFCVFTRYAWDVFGPFHEDAAHPVDVFGIQITASDGWAVGSTKSAYGRPA